MRRLTQGDCACVAPRAGGADAEPMDNHLFGPPVLGFFGDEGERDGGVKTAEAQRSRLAATARGLDAGAGGAGAGVIRAESVCCSS